MKKLLLTSSSDYFYDHIGEYVDKPLDEIKIAWITTAKKASGNPEYIEEHRKKMSEQEFGYLDIDIEGKSEDELRTLIDGSDVIYVHGGNTFHLLRAIKESSFEKIVREQLDKGVLFAGTSAGAYVACPTIEMNLWRRDIKYFPFENQDLTGMNLVPFLVEVHYEAKNKEDVKKGIANTDLEVYVLTDEQALYIEDDDVQLVGEGERIEFN